MNKFEYFYEVTAKAELLIDNIGDCCIVSEDTIGNQYFFISKTSFGKTRTMVIGPIIDKDTPCSKFSIEFNEFDFNERKLKKMISSFLSYSHANQADEINIEEIKELVKNPLEFIYDY